MSNFPSIEELDSGRMTATKVEDADDGHDLLDSAQDNFLAREQAVLGDDADFFQSGGTTSSPPAQGEASFFDGGNGTVFIVCIRWRSDEEVHEFESSFPALETSVHFSACPLMLTIEWLSEYSIPYASDVCAERRTWSYQVYTSTSPSDDRQWREERNLQIQRREEISQKKKQEVIEQAKQAIDDFYDNYNNQKEKAIAQTRYIINSNPIWCGRKEESEYLASRDETSGGTAWERIAKYVDISEKSGAGTGPTRYRELLLSLKNDTNAPSAEA
jgi:hypothetical protein